METVSKPVVSGEEYLKLPSEPTTWLVRGLVPSAGSCLFYGEAKTGKSLAVMQMSLAIVSGTSFLGFPVERNGPVVFLQLDTPRTMWLTYMKDLLASGVDVTPVFQADRETLPYPFDIMNPEHSHIVREAVMKVKPVMVVVDTIKESNHLNEDKSNDMQMVKAAWTAALMPAAICFITHPKKPQFEHPDNVINDSRGSNYWSGAVDIVAKLTPKTLYLKGRARADESVRVRRLPNYFWELDSDDGLIEAILTDASFKTQADQARELSVRAEISFDTAKKRLQRYEKQNAIKSIAEPSPADEPTP